MDKFTLDGQEPKIVEKLITKVQDMLTSGEHINYIAIQKKPAVTILPDSITISNKRIFMCEFTKLGLATDFEIFSWKDIKDIAFKEEIFGSKVTVIPFTGENLSIDYIPKVQARRLYQLIKEAIENYKKEERLGSQQNVSSNPVTAAAATPAAPQEAIPPLPASPPASPSMPPVFESNPANESLDARDYKEALAPDRSAIGTATARPAPVEEPEDEMTLKLKKLKTLFDKQLITQAEYESKKNEILTQL